MDWINLRKKVSGFASKYKFVLIVFLVGLAFMVIPSSKDGKQEEMTVQTVEMIDVSEQLQQILSKINGVGRVEVMLTIAYGEKTIYQQDQDFSGGENGSSRIETVIITDSNRTENGLIQQINPPVYQGAIIVCQGADSVSVRLNIIEAVSKITGLGTDRISVLKMK